MQWEFVVVRMAQAEKQRAELENVAGVDLKGPTLVTYVYCPCSIVFKAEPGARRGEFRALACGGSARPDTAAHLHH